MVSWMNNTGFMELHTISFFNISKSRQLQQYCSFEMLNKTLWSCDISKFIGTSWKRATSEINFIPLKTTLDTLFHRFSRQSFSVYNNLQRKPTQYFTEVQQNTLHRRRNIGLLKDICMLVSTSYHCFYGPIIFVVMSCIFFIFVSHGFTYISFHYSVWFVNDIVAVQESLMVCFPK